MTHLSEGQISEGKTLTLDNYQFLFLISVAADPA